MSGFVLGRLDLYFWMHGLVFGCLDLYLGVWTCILGTVYLQGVCIYLLGVCIPVGCDCGVRAPTTHALYYNLAVGTVFLQNHAPVAAEHAVCGLRMCFAIVGLLVSFQKIVHLLK